MTCTRAWALESYALAQSYVYGPLPAPTVAGTTSTDQLSAAYAKNATQVTGDQLLKAGYRLAAVLNTALVHLAATRSARTARCEWTAAKPDSCRSPKKADATRSSASDCGRSHARQPRRNVLIVV